MTNELSKYIKQIQGVIPPDSKITNEELIELIQDEIDPNKNMELLFAKNITFIYKIALPFSASCEMFDLMQESYFGLIEAVKKFDLSTEYKFLTYATHWIKQVLRRYTQNNGKLKRIPIHTLELISKYQKFRCDFEGEHSFPPSDEDCVKFLGISKQKLKVLDKYIIESNNQSIYDLIPGTDNLTVADLVADDFNLEESVLDDVCTEQDKAVIWGSVKELDNRCQSVIERHYKQNMTLQSIAKEEKLSFERIRQIERKGILYLKKKQDIKEMALRYGYDCSTAYHGGFRSFKNKQASSVEELAIKNIEIDERWNAIKEWYLNERVSS